MKPFWETMVDALTVGALSFGATFAGVLGIGVILIHSNLL